MSLMSFSDASDASSRVAEETPRCIESLRDDWADDQTSRDGEEW
jgi:hypothetical protein